MALILLASCSSDAGKDGDYSLQPDTVTGRKKIKKITQKFYDLKDTSLVPVQHIQQFFNDSGRMTSELFLDASFTMFGTKGYIYNKYGTLSSYSYVEDTYKETYTATFDTNDSIAHSIMETKSNHILQKKQVTKFRNGMAEEKSEYDGDGHLKWTDKYEWSKDYKSLVKKGFDSQGKIDFVSHYTYNEKGEEKDYFSLSPEGDTLGKALYTYNSDNKLADYSEYRMGVLEQREAYEYGPNGKLKQKKTYDDKGNVLAIYDFVYNANGDLVLKTRKTQKGTIVFKVEYEIEYRE